MSRGKFSGPIEEIVGNTCPGASYCVIDQCFRNGKTCGNDNSCCLDRSQAQDLVSALGCGNGNFMSKQKFSSLSEDPTAMSKCSTELTLGQSDIDFMCKDLSSDNCFEKMCDLGCTSKACPKKSIPGINLQNQVCQTIQQYCDVLDPSLLSESTYNTLCCNIDPIAGVPVRTVCGCSGNPCNSNPVVMQKVQDLKNKAVKYWAENPPLTGSVIPVDDPSPPIQPVVQPQIVVEPSSPKNKSISIKKYLFIIFTILILIGGGLYWYFRKHEDIPYHSPF